MSVGQAIAVVSGKGGTGKTAFTANVGMALAQMGYATLCLDCDIGLRNLDIAMAMTDRAVMDFTDVLAGRCALEEAAVSLLAGQSTREYGARPLRRAIASLVEDPAADLMLTGQLKKGDTLCVSAQGDEVKVRLV